MFRKIDQNDSLLIIIDVQEKLVNMLEKRTVEAKTSILATTAKALEIPTIVTEQYPKGLGSTVELVKNNLPENALFFEKTSFSACESEEVTDAIKRTGRKQVILCGIEAHICVLQTALSLINHGYEVYIAKDACASRNKYEFNLAIDRLQQAGSTITCTEMVIFELLASAKHPKFKELQALIK